MKKKLMLFCFVALALPVTALAGVDVNVNVGIPVPLPPPPPRVLLPPPPPPPPRVIVPAPPAIVFERPPMFLAPPRLGFYVGVDVPYDIVYVDNYYYLNYRNAWYRSSVCNGPWVSVQQERLPLVVRRQGVEYIRHHRDREFALYRRDHDHYRGRPFWAGHDGRDPRWGDRRDWKDDRRDWKEERKRQHEAWKYDRRDWKDERKREHEERKDDRRQAREDWKRERWEDHRGR